MPLSFRKPRNSLSKSLDLFARHRVIGSPDPEPVGVARLALGQAFALIGRHELPPCHKRMTELAKYAF
jgi:hypothetical protein